MLCKRRTGDRYRSGAAVKNTLYTSCRTEGRQLVAASKPKVLGLQFKDGIGRADRDNAIDLYIGDEYMDLLADGVWEKHLQ